MFVSPVVAMEHIKTGKLRALAVTTRRSATNCCRTCRRCADTVPGYEFERLVRARRPHGTPGEIVDLLNKAVNAGLADPKMRARYTDSAAASSPATPAAFGKLIADETEKWGRVVKFAGLKPV